MRAAKRAAPLTRSENMGRIRSNNTRPEVLLRRALWAAGSRFRVNHRTPGGRADVVFLRAKIAVFVDGCFWHGCPEHYVSPRTGSQFWAKKLSENLERDERQTKTLKAEGWTVIRVWEHEVLEDSAAVVAQLLREPTLISERSTTGWRVTAVECSGVDGSTERRYLRRLLGMEQRIEEGPRTTAKLKRVHRKQVG